MVKKVALAIAGLLAILIVMGVAGFRLAMDGSGKMPRFLVRPHADVLEQHRAQQRAASEAGTSQAPRPGRQPPANAATDQTPQSGTPGSGTQDLANLRKEQGSVDAPPADSPSKPSSPATWTDFRGP